MLTDTQIRNLKPAEKAKKYADGGGLYLYVAKTGSKLWRMAYRFNDKEKLLSFGEYPIVSLKDARSSIWRQRLFFPASHWDLLLLSCSQAKVL